MFVVCEIEGKKFRAETDYDVRLSPCQQKETREKLFLLLRDIADMSFKSGSVQQDVSCGADIVHSETPIQDPNRDDEVFFGVRFFVVDLGEGKKYVTRSKNMRSDGVPLTRRDLYRGRWEQAECEYAKSFMCGGFPTEPDPTRPTKDDWLDDEPYEFEVDKFVSEKLFG